MEKNLFLINLGNFFTKKGWDVMKQYKDTLLMPQTDFEMRANLKDKEIIIQDRWIKEKIYHQVLKKNKDYPKFILHDGPPYANGNIHVGHAFNKILKDIIVRQKNMTNFYAPYLMGWDTHGLPIETAISKLGIKRKELDPVDFRLECRKYALEQINNQNYQFARLGIFTDYNQRYVTLDKEYEANQIEIFIKMIEQNIIYRGLKPVYWSPSSESALAEAEIEYAEKRSPSVFVSFNLFNDEVEYKLLIWTTTPWTLTANQLVAVGSEYDYVIVNVNKNNYIVAEKLLTNVAKQCQWEDYKVIKTIKGKELVGWKYFHPIYFHKVSTIVNGDHVTLTDGTGIVHTACGFGIDDFNLGQVHNIVPFVPINDRGYFTNELDDPTLENVFYEDANKIITSRLKLAGSLVKLDFINHQYPHDWRTKKPVIYRATKQWFVSIEKIKTKLIAAINCVQWYPQWARERMQQMISNRQDWCISRQRLWGVPIPIIYDNNNEPIYDLNLLNHFKKLFEKYGTDIWYSWSLEQLLPKNYHPEQENFIKEKDIMDVWFDSGTSHWNLWKKYHWAYPVDVYLEGSDQFRGWFNSSLITAVISDQKQAPYKTVLANGFINDENGKKMSKSIGNVVDPLQVCNEYGADILRLWTASVDFLEESRIGTLILKQVSENYRKIRNTMRFLLGNLFDFQEKDLVNNFDIVDQYLLIKIVKFQKDVQTAYNNYQFHQVVILTNNFINNDLSSFYLDFIKDILYVEKNDSVQRRTVQTILYYILKVLLFNLHPILIHTTEEVYQYFNIKNKKNSLMLEEKLDLEQLITNENNVLNLGNRLLQLRTDVNLALEKARNDKLIGKSLEAKVIITLKKSYEQLETISNLSKILIVSEVEIIDEVNKSQNEYDSSFINVIKKDGIKCSRCWIIVDKIEIINDICLRCQGVLKK